MIYSLIIPIYQRFSTLLFLWIVFILPFSGIAQKTTLSLDEAVRIAMERAYNIKVSKVQQKIAENDNTRGNAGMLPVVTGAISKNYTISSVTLGLFDPNLAPIERSGVPNNTGGIGVNAVWTLYDGMGMFIAKERLSTIQKATYTQTESQVENTVAQVATAYYDIIRQSRRVTNLKHGLEISNDRLKLAKDRYEVGQGSKVDFLSAQVDYNEDKAALLAQEQALESAKYALNSLLVRDLSTEFSTNDTFMLDKKLSLTTLRDAMVKLNPSLALAAMNRQLADMAVKAEKAKQYPQVALVTGYNYNTANNGAGAPQATKSSQNYAFNYGIRATIPIFDGYNQKRRIQNAKLNTETLAFQESDLRNQLNTALERTYLSYNNSLELIKLETENYKIARQNIEIAFERYKVGNATSYELREVQRNAVAAETRLIDAECNAKISEVELLRLSSKLVE